MSIEWKEERCLGQREVHRDVAKVGACTLEAFPLPRKGGFMVKSSELGDNWSAHHHALRNAIEFGWKVWVGDMRIPSSLVAQGKCSSLEGAKRNAVLDLARWSKGVYREASRDLVAGRGRKEGTG